MKTKQILCKEDRDYLSEKYLCNDGQPRGIRAWESKVCIYTSSIYIKIHSRGIYGMERNQVPIYQAPQIRYRSSQHRNTPTKTLREPTLTQTKEKKRKGGRFQKLLEIVPRVSYRRYKWEQCQNEHTQDRSFYTIRTITWVSTN